MMEEVETILPIHSIYLQKGLELLVALLFLYKQPQGGTIVARPFFIFL